MTKKSLPGCNGKVPLAICAIGASAGGIKALSSWFDAVPANLGVAYVVIVHLAPDHPSELAAALQPHTDMPVRQVQNKLPFEADHVYVVPPDRRLSLTDDSIESVPFAEHIERRAPIDQFFRALAESHHNATGVILSGAGSDGAVGIKAIKEAGGLVLVQDPQDAEFSLMPRSAIASGIVDIILPLPELAERFAEVVHTSAQLAKAPAEMPAEDKDIIQSILSALRVRTGHDFSQYKGTTLARRIARRMQVTRCSSLREYHKFLQSNSEETHELLSDILISVTSFFRDPAAFEALSCQIIPALFGESAADAGIRAWVPACATGEEAYSIAMLLLEEANRRSIRPTIQVFATDIDAVALATAREGRYPSSIEADVSDERLRRFFTRDGASYVIQKDLRELIVFAAHNVLRDPPFTRLDLISCRNFLIYLERDLQNQLSETFHYALKPSRYLFLGSAEGVDASFGLFSTVDKDQHIFQSKLRAGSRTASVSNFTLQPQIGDASIRRRRTTHSAPVSSGDLHRLGLEENAPPSVLVDEEHRIIHFSETAGKYILPTAGPISTDIKSIARPELRFEIQKVLKRVFSKNEPSLSFPVSVVFNGTTRRVAVQAVPMRKSDQPPYAIVFFIDAGEADSRTDFSISEPLSGATNVIRQLESELSQTRDQLRGTIEDYEATNEELRAANEELQSTNEEYRSTSEELETSKEELQSLNEELQTVNAELKLNLERMTRAHNDLQNMIASSAVGTLFLDTDLKIRLFTPKVSELFSVVASDVGRPITDFTHYLAYEGLVRDAQQVLRNLIPVEREVRSQDRYFLMRIQPYRTSDNRIEGVVVTFIDVTKDRVSQRQIRQQATLIDMSPDAIIVRTLEGKIEYWSRGAEQLYGFSPSEVRGQISHELLRSRPFVPLDHIEAELRRTGRWQGELTHLTRDGREVVVFSRWQVERNLDDGQEFILESNIDVTDRKLAETKLAEANAALEQRVTERTQQLEEEMSRREAAQATLAQTQRMDAISQLAGGIAHDVNNLLMVICGNLEIAQRLSSDRKILSSMKEAMSAVEMGASLTHRLLLLARRRKAEPEQLNLNNRVNIMEPLLRRTLGEQISVSVKLDRNLSNTMIDPVEIDNALLNLALNARDAMPKSGTLTIETSEETLDEPAAEKMPNATCGDYVILTVSDTGAGMPAEVVRRAIEPFFTTKEPGKGTGLGLSTIYAMAQSYGGFMAIESEVGKGTSVRIYLPTAGTADSGQVSRSANNEEAPMGDGQLILVVEDDDPVLKITHDRLESLGYAVIEASSGRQALDMLMAGEPVVLVFTDIRMPGDLSGYDVAEWVIANRPEIKVVFATGHGEVPSGASDAVKQIRVLPKPYTRSQLARAIRDAFEASGS